MPKGMSHIIRPKTGLGVVVTRPEPGLSETLAALEGAGWQAYASSALEVVPRQFSYTHGAFSALVLTSGQAVPCASDAVPKTVPVYAVGDRTAQRARAAGFQQVYSAQGNAKDLVALLEHHKDALQQARLLQLSGRQQGYALAQDLRNRGFKVLRRVAYAAHPVKEIAPDILMRLQAGEIGSILFFSAESAKAWLGALPPGMVPLAMRCAAFVLSPSVGAVLHQAGWQKVHVAKQPNAAALLALLGRCSETPKRS